MKSFKEFELNEYEVKELTEFQLDSLYEKFEKEFNKIFNAILEFHDKDIIGTNAKKDINHYLDDSVFSDKEFMPARYHIAFKEKSGMIYSHKYREYYADLQTDISRILHEINSIFNSNKDNSILIRFVFNEYFNKKIISFKPDKKIFKIKDVLFYKFMNIVKSLTSYYHAELPLKKTLTDKFLISKVSIKDFMKDHRGLLSARDFNL